MPREIKYRIWSKVINRWITDNLLDNLADTNITLNDLFASQKHIIFQQFTGLLDKNGRDIYEGDIVKFHYFGFDGNEIDKIKIAEIKYNSLLATFWLSLHEEEWFRVEDTTHLEEPCIEVLGNIFENPELLK